MRQAGIIVSSVMFNKTLKRLIAKTCVAALLFMQFAVAAYACTAVGGPASAIAAANSESMQTAMPGCDMNNAADTPAYVNLCLQHCQSGDQSVQTLDHLAVPAFVATSALTVLIPLSSESDSGSKVPHARV